MVIMSTLEFWGNVAFVFTVGVLIGLNVGVHWWKRG